MSQRISFAKYRAVDLATLAALMALSQTLIYLASSQWFPDQLYVVSPVAAIVTIVMMRWGVFSAIHAVLGGAVFAALSGGTWQHFLIYCAGNALSLLMLLLFRAFGKEKIRIDTVWSLAFALGVQALMQLGRAGIAAALGNGLDVCLGFITTDILSEIFTVFIVWIVRRIDGLFEDQKQYLLRIQSERQS